MRKETKQRRVALYARVSKRNGRQDPEVQLQALREVAGQAGWQIAPEHVYVDHGISGAKGRDKRPALDAMLKNATRRKFDMVAVWSTDRLGRSLTDLLGSLNTLKEVGCDLYIHSQALDTSTSGGKALFQMMGVFAELEREIIVERVNAGIDRARAKGSKLGRPGLDPKTVAAIKERAAAGEGKRAIGRALDVSEAAVRKVLATA
jgi:DNA invertase Pin-like site-specific DNA recombinase